MARRGQGSVFQKAGTACWTIQYYVKGERVRKSTGTTNRSDAVKLLNQRLTEEGREVPSKPRRRDKHPSGVYFIECNGFIKIGYAERPTIRLSDLQTGNPIRLRLLLVVAGPPEAERVFHKRFSELRHHGEWFRMEGGLADFLKPQYSPTFDGNCYARNGYRHELSA